MPIVAITGNYGMGKSTVAGFFREMGAETLDLDDVVDELLKEESIIEGIRRLLGDGILTEKGIDRAEVARIVFSERDKRESLERLLHPIIIERMREFLTKKDKRQVIVVEIPLLFEKGFESEFDSVVTVYTDIETALKRLEKKGISRDDALRRLQAQMPVDEKIRRSDFVIDNCGSIGETKKQVFEIYEKIKT